MDAPLYPAPNSKSFRPPSPGAAPPTPKPSAAPAPRLRPTAPAARGDAPLPSAEVQASPTDQLADMLAAQRSNAAKTSASSASHAKVAARAQDPFFFRKTIIPILLTFGIILAGWATLILTAGDDNALGDMFPRWTPIALSALALIFFLLAALNMLAVRKDEANSPR